MLRACTEMLTPPKAGPGTAGILPARSRKARCRQGRRACPPRARRSPAMPRNRPPQPPGAIAPNGRNGIIAARLHRNAYPAEGGARDRGHPCPHVPARRDVGKEGAPAPGPAEPRNAPQPPPATAGRDRPARPERAKRRQCCAPAPKCLPRRRRGPGPRASCPHVPAHRGGAGKGAAHFSGTAGVSPARRRPARRRRSPGSAFVRRHVL